MSKGLSMKRLTQFLMNWNSAKSKDGEDIEQIEKDQVIVLRYFDYIWEHRND